MNDEKERSWRLFLQRLAPKYLYELSCYNDPGLIDNYWWNAFLKRYPSLAVAWDRELPSASVVQVAALAADMIEVTSDGNIVLITTMTPKISSPRGDFDIDEEEEDEISRIKKSPLYRDNCAPLSPSPIDLSRVDAVADLLDGCDDEDLVAVVSSWNCLEEMECEDKELKRGESSTRPESLASGSNPRQSVDGPVGCPPNAGRNRCNVHKNCRKGKHKVCPVKTVLRKRKVKEKKKSSCSNKKECVAVPVDGALTSQLSKDFGLKYTPSSLIWGLAPASMVVAQPTDYPYKKILASLARTVIGKDPVGNLHRIQIASSIPGCVNDLVMSRYIDLVQLLVSNHPPIKYILDRVHLSVNVGAICISSKYLYSSDVKNVVSTPFGELSNNPVLLEGLFTGTKAWLIAVSWLITNCYIPNYRSDADDMMPKILKLMEDCDGLCAFLGMCKMDQTVIK